MFYRCDKNLYHQIETEKAVSYGEGLVVSFGLTENATVKVTGYS